MFRQKINRPHRQICLGDLQDKIILRTRDMKAPVFGETTFTEDFERKVKDVWAAVLTTEGKEVFDGVNTGIPITHRIIIRWTPDLTSENWIELQDGRLLDIINVQNYEERNELLELLCRVRGQKSLPGNQA